MKTAYVTTTSSLGSGKESLNACKKMARVRRDQGHEAEVVYTTDSVALSNSEDSQVHCFNTSRGLFQKQGASPELANHLRLNRYDLLHHFGVGKRSLHYVRQSAQKQSCPFLISPLGALGPHRNKRSGIWASLRKTFVHPQALKQASGWHVFSQGESETVRQLGFEQPVCVAPPGVHLPSEHQLQLAKEFWWEREPRLRERQVTLFHSRFNNRKRVVELLEIWRKLKPQDWVLLLVGEDDQYSVEQLRKQVLMDGTKDTILVHGGSLRPPPYAVANLFVLPSQQSSHGREVKSAMAAGLPVISTDTESFLEINDHEAGWTVPYAEFDDTLKYALGESTAVLGRRGQRARDLVEARFTWKITAEKLGQFYQELL